MTQERYDDGRFGGKIGSAPDITLSNLPEKYDYEYVKDEGTGNVVVILRVPHGTPRNEYVDVPRSRIGPKEYQPEIRQAITVLKSQPDVVDVLVIEGDPE